MPIQRPKSISSQVNDLLRQRIHDRFYPPGGRLPSESELAQELGVSRATVRTVLAKLAGDGLILRKQGDGTYVNERIRDIDSRYGGIWDFSRLIEANGYKPTIETLAIRVGECAPAAARALYLEPGTTAVTLTRLFRADAQPVIHAVNTIPEKIFISSAQDLNGQLPIHRILREYCREQIAYAVSDIEPALLPPEMAATFQAAAPKMVLLLNETFFNRDNTPLVHGISHFDQSLLRLRLVQAWG